MRRKDNTDKKASEIQYQWAAPSHELLVVSLGWVSSLWRPALTSLSLADLTSTSFLGTVLAYTFFLGLQFCLAFVLTMASLNTILLLLVALKCFMTSAVFLQLLPPCQVVWDHTQCKQICHFNPFWTIQVNMREYTLGFLTFFWKFPLISNMENSTMYLIKSRMQCQASFFKCGLRVEEILDTAAPTGHRV